MELIIDEVKPGPTPSVDEFWKLVRAFTSKYSIPSPERNYPRTWKILRDEAEIHLDLSAAASLTRAQDGTGMLERFGARFVRAFEAQQLYIICLHIYGVKPSGLMTEESIEEYRLSSVGVYRE